MLLSEHGLTSHGSSSRSGDIIQLLGLQDSQDDEDAPEEQRPAAELLDELDAADAEVQRSVHSTQGAPLSRHSPDWPSSTPAPETGIPTIDMTQVFIDALKNPGSLEDTSLDKDAIRRLQHPSTEHIRKRAHLLCALRNTYSVLLRRSQTTPEDPRGLTSGGSSLT